MKKILTQFGSALTTVALLFGLGAGTTYVALASATTLRVVQTPTIHLYAGISASATSARVTGYPKDLDGNKLTITDFGSNPTFTVDPKVSGYEEIIGFTGITDNGDNTAILTGLSRDLLSKYPYTTAGTGRTHGAGATVVFGNNPQIYGRLGALENDQSWLGINTFSSTSLPRLDLDPTTWIGVPGYTLTDKAYVDSVAIAGASNADNATKGIGQMANATQAASSTRLGSTGARLVLGADIATSSPWSGATSTVVVTQINGKIHPSFLNGTDAYTFNGTTTMATSTVASTTVNSFLASYGTTTIAASGANKSLVINTIPYIFPNTQGASSSVLATDGTGRMSWKTGGPQYSISQTGFTVTNGYATSTALAIPANTLTGSSTITVIGNGQCQHGTSSGSCTFYLRTSSGATLATWTDGITAQSITYTQFLNLTVANTGAVNSQASTVNLLSINTSGTNVTVSVQMPTNNNGTSAIDLSQATSLVFVENGSAAQVSPLLNYTMVVTP